MSLKLYDSELKVMEILWKEGDMAAGKIAKILKDHVEWNRNTTYTVIGKLIAKGAIVRHEPNYICKATITREEIQKSEAAELIGKLFGGSAEAFISAFYKDEKLSDEQIVSLKKIVEGLR